MSDDSDSSRHDPTLPNAELEKALRHTVRQIYKVGNVEDLTIKRVRKAVEEQLDLRDGFFKAHGNWNQRSKDVIQSEVVGIRPAILDALSTHNDCRTPSQMNLRPHKRLHVQLPQRSLRRNSNWQRSRRPLSGGRSGPPWRNRGQRNVGRRMN